MIFSSENENCRVRRVNLWRMEVVKFVANDMILLNISTISDQKFENKIMNKPFEWKMKVVEFAINDIMLLNGSTMSISKFFWTKFAFEIETFDWNIAFSKLDHFETQRSLTEFSGNLCLIRFKNKADQHFEKNSFRQISLKNMD